MFVATAALSGRSAAEAAALTMIGPDLHALLRPFHPGQLPALRFRIKRRKDDRFAHPLELRHLPQLRVFPKRVIDVHADGDQSARAVEEAEVEDVVAHEFAEGMAEDAERRSRFAVDEHLR